MKAQMAISGQATVTLAQSVTDELRALVMAGELKPCERLQEVSLSQRLGVSRTPVRAALHSLAAEGLLTYTPNRGYRVCSIDAERLVTIFDLRGVLEGLAARLAAERGMNETEIAEFRAALEQGDAIMASGILRATDRDAFAEVNARIHQLIVAAADDRMLADMIRVCHNIPISSERNVMWTDYDWLRRSHDDHHRVLDAIVLRDGPRAEQLMREHVHSVKLQVRAQLAQPI